jgi:hypothetical protein
MSKSGTSTAFRIIPTPTVTSSTFTRRLKARTNLPVYTRPDELRRIKPLFIAYYNHRHHHEVIGNVTPAECTTDDEKKSSTGAAAALQSGPLEPRTHG